MGGVSSHPYSCAVAESYLTLRDLMDYTPGSSVHGMSQAKMLDG